MPNLPQLAAVRLEDVEHMRLDAVGLADFDPPMVTWVFRPPHADVEKRLDAFERLENLADCLLTGGVVVGWNSHKAPIEIAYCVERLIHAGAYCAAFAARITSPAH